MTESCSPLNRLSRRRFLGFTAATAGLALASACGDDDDGEATPTASATTAPATPTPTVQPASPTARATPTATAGAGPSLAEKAGQMIMAGFRGLSLDASDPFVRDLQDHHIGGAVLFSYDVPLASPVRNVESPDQVRQLIEQLQDFAPSPVLVAVDQEGGLVARFNEDHGFPATLSAAELAALGDPMATRAHAAEMAITLADAGVTINLAPVADLNVNPENPVIGGIERSFSADPAVVVAQAGAFIEGMHERGILASLKHFPGHGSSTADSHLGFVDVTETWSEIELQPFRQLIEAGLADSVMTAHIFNSTLDPEYPATLSQATIQGLLRGQLGFDGVVVSDDMQMGAITDHYGFEEAIRLSVNAGVDMLIIGNNIAYDVDAPRNAAAAIIRMVDAGEILQSRVDEAYTRIQALKARMQTPVASP